jgi:hypothetical protein
VAGWLRSKHLLWSCAFRKQCEPAALLEARAQKTRRQVTERANRARDEAWRIEASRRPAAVVLPHRFAFAIGNGRNVIVLASIRGVKKRLCRGLLRHLRGDQDETCSFGNDPCSDARRSDGCRCRQRRGSAGPPGVANNVGPVCGYFVADGISVAKLHLRAGLVIAAQSVRGCVTSGGWVNGRHPAEAAASSFC